MRRFPLINPKKQKEISYDISNKTLYPEPKTSNDETEFSADILFGENDKAKIPKAKFGYSLICVIIIAALAAICVIAGNLNTAYTTVSISFSEITMGCNPDGSPFDIYEVLRDEVLTSACDKLNNRLTPEMLREHISVTGITTDGSFNAIRQNVLDGNDTYSYFPSKYTISYSVISNSIKANGIPASVGAVLKQFVLPSKGKIIAAVADSYKEYYEDKYIFTSAVFDVDWSETKSLDYFNRAGEMQNVINRINRYLSSRYDEDVRFVSKDGVSFGDLSAELSRITDNDVETYKAFVIQNGITADKDKLLKQFGYVSKENYEQTQRNRGEYNIMLDGISVYDPLVTKVVFIPALDSENIFYMNRTKIGIDYLTENASKANLSGDESENEAHYYDYLIDQFSAFEESADWVKKAADKQCDDITAKIDEFLKRAAAVNDEYINTVSYETLYISGIGHGQGVLSSVVTIVKITVIWSAVLYLWWLIYSVLKRKKIKKEKSDNAVA